MPRQVDQFYRGPQEVTPLPGAAAGWTGQIVKDGPYLVGDIALRPGKPSLKSHQIGLIAVPAVKGTTRRSLDLRGGVFGRLLDQPVRVGKRSRHQSRGEGHLVLFSMLTG